MAKTTAKTASKNNPNMRNKNENKKSWNGKPIKPLQYIAREGRVKMIVAQYDDGSMVVDENGNPLNWSDIK